MNTIDLDHNATTPLDPRVLEAMLPWLQTHHGNPSSLHSEGRKARRAVEDARESVAALFEAEPDEIIFTSGATEANALALHGRLLGPRGNERARVGVLSIEHPSAIEPLRRLAADGVIELECLPVDRQGCLILAECEAGLKHGLDLVVVMAANNEVGSIQPIKTVTDMCRSYNCDLHIDAVQIIGKHLRPTPWPRLDGGLSVSLSAHKFGGPKGVGALWVERGTTLRPQLSGGGQERDYRAGTENVAAIVGLGEAARWAICEEKTRRAKLEELEAGFLLALREEAPDLVRHGPMDGADRLAGTLSIRFPGIPGERLLLGCDLEGVAISLGSACSSGAAEPSPVLNAMGINKVDNLESVRLSLGWEQSITEVKRAASIIGRVLARNRSGPENY